MGSKLGSPRLPPAALGSGSAGCTITGRRSSEFSPPFGVQTQEGAVQEGGRLPLPGTLSACIPSRKCHRPEPGSPLAPGKRWRQPRFIGLWAVAERLGLGSLSAVKHSLDRDLGNFPVQSPLHFRNEATEARGKCFFYTHKSGAAELLLRIRDSYFSAPPLGPVDYTVSVCTPYLLLHLFSLWLHRKAQAGLLVG